jgi:hypothetical protein
VDLRYQAGRDIEVLGRTGDNDFLQIGFLMGFGI